MITRGAKEAAGSSAAAIADYAIIGDCRTAALVSREGSIDWLCLPHFSASSVFAGLLDMHHGGRFSIQPRGHFRCSRRYVPGTAVLETTFEASHGAARLTDLMPVCEKATELTPMREVLRSLECVEGEVLFDLHWDPRPDYGRAAQQTSVKGALGWSCVWLDELFHLFSEAPLELAPNGSGVIGCFRMRAGEKVRFSMSYTKADIGVIAPLGADADRRITETCVWWRSWINQCSYVGPFSEAVVRSAITLKLMTFALSGAVVAAPTTSLPEAVGADRNWDYRYCWLRDAALTMQAFTGLGFRDEAASFFQWLLHATRLTWPELQVMYDVYGRTSLREIELRHLHGYAASRPVRIGNAAHEQLQLDAYGSVLAAALDFVVSGGVIAADECKLLVGFASTVLKAWRQPDSGIWEARGAPRHYTFSKVMCWKALDCILKLHQNSCVSIQAEVYARERDAIRNEIENRGYNDDIKSYVSELDGDRIDAALLLMGCLGYNDPTDLRMRNTFETVSRRLERNGLLYRYEEGSDGFASREGAFGLCSFWAIDNLALRGDFAAAEQKFRHVLSFANDVGLFAEEIDPDTGAALGNFPQAFTHVGVINAALGLARKEEKCTS